jgi:hypothetical protein
MNKNNAIKDKVAYENEHKVSRTGPCRFWLTKVKKKL